MKSVALFSMTKRNLLCLVLTFVGFFSQAIAHSEVQKSTQANGTNSTDSVPSEIKKDSQAKSFFDGLMPEIQRKKAVETAIQNSVRTNSDVKVQAWHEFLSHWPSAKQNVGFAWQKDLQKFKGGLDATAVIEDRHILQIILDCDVSKDYAEVTFTNLRLSFEEVKTVSPQSGDAWNISFNAENGHWLGLKEWNQLKDAAWDFSKVGINIISNAPVSHIHEAFP